MTSDPQASHSVFFVTLSFVIAMLCSVFPLPLSWGWYRPEFVALLTIYWIVAMPQQIGVLTAFFVGLVQDLVEFSVLGLHALALVAVAYVCTLAHRRIRNYALWQQSVWVFILVGLHQLFWNWVHGFNGPSADSLIFLMPALVSGLLWPVVLIMMEWYRLKTHSRYHY